MSRFSPIGCTRTTHSIRSLRQSFLQTRFEYKFVRLEETKSRLPWLGLSAPAPSAKEGYQESIHQHASQGWRLVQIFAPGISMYGSAAYYELIFEREIHLDQARPGT